MSGTRTIDSNIDPYAEITNANGGLGQISGKILGQFRSNCFSSPLSQVLGQADSKLRSGIGFVWGSGSFGFKQSTKKIIQVGPTSVSIRDQDIFSVHEDFSG
ncbi:hypothetical protein FCM35_KLT05458 [Carex littledalei]|uniref:Uncharacterized protein n=1 Tax=Carex littledalei TaxID=544730 RepID=A0A833R0I3_9POAL|nr:hypothetical protein FCM35_KLT05458 [Carex littledalei]